MSLSILAILFLAVLAAVSAGTSASPTVTKWSQLSTIYMVTPILIGGFIVLAILGAIVYGMAKLLDILPIYTRTVQGFFRQMGVVIRKWSDSTVQPVLAIKSWWAGFEAALKHIGH